MPVQFSESAIFHLPISLRVALSLPEMLILRRVLKLQLIAAFIGIVCIAIIFTGYPVQLGDRVNRGTGSLTGSVDQRRLDDLVHREVVDLQVVLDNLFQCPERHRANQLSSCHIHAIPGSF